ncbi:MAG TPA: metal ABC transporter substrate-binding protein [Treponema sp.]|nr:metal ABC transporter substrate-binding protein [Treponema sp.]
MISLPGKAALFLLLCLPFVALSCAKRGDVSRNGGNSGGESRPVVAVSILPQTWFVARIAGERARTVVLVGPGQSPHSYEPSPRQMRELSQAGVWVLSGAEFEISLLPKIQRSFPGLKIIDGAEGVSFRSLEESDSEENMEQGIDRHTWLGSAAAKILAAHVRDALVFVDPAGEEMYDENCAALIGEIDAEFAALREELAFLKGRSVFVYHPSFGYFLDEFGIHQEAVESGGKEPGPRALNDLIEKAKRENAAAIFVQSQFPVSAAKTVADAVGARVVNLDPLAPDWFANIRLMGDTLKEAAARDVLQSAVDADD